METLQQLDYERYLACLFAGPRDRDALFGLHSLNAELGRVRESVSEPMLGEIRLTWWREAIEGFKQGQVRKHPVIETIAMAVADDRLDADALIDMVNARIADLYEDAPADKAALKDYAQRTGGTVMQQAAAVAAAETQSAAARSIGAAMTQGGVVRSIAFHASMRRLHLPGEALDAMGLTAEDVFQGNFTPAIADLAKSLGHDALALLTQGLKQRWAKRTRKALVPAVFALEDLRAASKSNFDPQAAQASAPRAIKLAKSWWFIHTGFI